MEAIKTVALVDDDLKPVRLIDLDEKTRNSLNDDTSDEFEYALEFAREHSLTPHDLDVDNTSEVNEFFNGDKFVADVLNHHEFSKNAPVELAESLSIALESSKLVRNESVFDVIRKAFPDTQFEITEFFKRPDEVSVLAEYDLVIMDLMMEDEHDTPEGVAIYIKGITNRINAEGKLPAFILMSSRKELNIHRKEIRQKAQISSLGFRVIGKKELDCPTGTDRLNVIWQQMSDNKDMAMQLRTFNINCEESLKNAWEKTSQVLWNIDAAFLQQMHINTSNENVPFSDHLLSLITRHHLSIVESSPNIQESLIGLASLFKGNEPDERAFQSHSLEAPAAIHELTAAYYFSGLSLPDLIPIKTENLTEDKLVGMLPFGAILIKDERVIHGGNALIHCTQQCDLSRSVIKHDMSLVFLESKVSNTAKFDKKNGEYIVYPLPFNSNGDKLYLHVNLKKLISKPHDEFIKELKVNKYHVELRLREEIVRQLRAESFQKLSRIENNVETKHEICLAKALLHIKDGNGDTHKLWFESDDNTKEHAKQIELTQFSGDKGKISTHFIGPESLELIMWAIQNCRNSGIEHPNATEITEIITTKLPKKNSTNNDYANLHFRILDNLGKLSPSLSRHGAELIFYVFD